MDIALSLAGLIAVGIKIVSLFKFIEVKNTKAIKYQVGAWVVFILLTFWGANIQGIQNTTIGDIQLGDMSGWTLLYVGFALGSSGSLLVDGIKALDNTQSASI